MAANNILAAPVINIYASPLPGVPPIQVTPKVGDLILSHTPVERMPWVCVVNGLPLKREYWRRREIFMGDVIELHPVVMGGGGSKSLLGVVAAIALSVFAPYAAGAILGAGASATAVSLLSAGIVLVGSALINALIMPKAPGLSANDTPQASPTYNVAMAGNQARLNQPIPVGYGRMRSFPDYAAQPYTEFDTTENPDGDEYFYGLYAIGHGEYQIGAVTIGDTDINAFTDLEYRILPPGEQPQLVQPSVVTAIEVAGQVLSEDEFSGPFVACGPGRRLKKIAVDIICPRGLCEIDSSSGKPHERSVSIEVSYATINDAYTKTSEWITLPELTITAATLTPQRRTFFFDLLPDNPRVSVRMRRTEMASDDQYVYDEVVWGALRGYLANPAPLAPTVTHMELRIRANEQMSGASQRKIGVIWQRLLHTWTPEGGVSQLMPTRNPMWALADKWVNKIYGDGIPFEKIDIDSLYRIAQICEERRDRFDMVFDSRVSSFEADLTIGRVCRSSPIRRNGLRSVIRDERQDLPIAAFTPRNILQGSSSYQYMQVTDETADGVIVEYFDHNFFDWLEIECPQPGKTVTNPIDHRYNPDLPMMENPVRLQIPGITGPTQAEREGLYQAAVNALRRKYCKWQCELEGSLVYYSAPVLFAPTLHNAMQSGDVVDFDPYGMELTLSEPIELGPKSAMVFVRPDGTMTPPNVVQPGKDEWTVVLDGYSPLDFGDWPDDGARERTRYILLDNIEAREVVKMLAIRPRGEQRYEMYGVVEDDAIHEVDAHLLGQADDPDAFEPWSGEDSLVPIWGFVNLSDIEVVSYNDYYVTPLPASATFGADGVLRTKARKYASIIEEVVKRQWIANAPRDDVGSLFELMVRAPAGAWFDGDIPYTVSEDGKMFESDWLPLAEGVTLSYSAWPPISGRVSLREIGTENILENVRISLGSYVAEWSGA